MNETALSHYGNWIGVIIWILIYGIFLLFLPFYKKSQRKPTTTYLAFIIAYALEMFGIPMSMYFVAWFFGKQLPDGVLWGHTLNQYIGHFGMYICIILNIIGAFLVVLGWRTIYKKYWKYKDGKGKLVTTGIYHYIRHPQYTGFLLITLGMIFEWVTIPLLIMWPILVIVYYRLAKKEEKDMINEFGNNYIIYHNKTGMFFPKIHLKKYGQYTKTKS
ncbi:isoprenylcysteine carboxylmethyltransferase family protein [Clostridioides difficile]|nr:isoprenylcysteine carboxylmethyltransferase family protein [Clostridioides difficile]